MRLEHFEYVVRGKGRLPIACPFAATLPQGKGGEHVKN